MNNRTKYQCQDAPLDYIEVVSVTKYASGSCGDVVLETTNQVPGDRSPVTTSVTLSLAQARRLILELTATTRGMQV